MSEPHQRPAPGEQPTAELEPSVILGPEPVVVRWTREIAQAVPELLQAVQAFDAGQRPAGQSTAAWLRVRALDVPAESTTRLLVRDGRVLGFYALAAGEVQMSHRDRGELRLSRRTQPAVIITQLARGVSSAAGTGELLVLHAAGTARQIKPLAAANLLALDPFDEDTSVMWRNRYGFRETAAPGPGRELRRLWMALVP